MMIKKYNEFIREFVETGSDSVLDVKMQEIKELVDSIGGQAFMYEWENKNDHELFVNFTSNELVLRYEFDIDDLMLKKIASNVVDFETAVGSIDEGLDIIEKDIHSILGVSESYQGRWTESLKSEDVKQIYPMVKRILEIYPGESADQEGIVEELERKLRVYDDIVREYIIDTLMFGDPDISFDELERKVIDLGDRIYDMGTERRMVIDAFEAAFQVIGKHFYLTEKRKLN
jgi:phosphosulfolactate synthase (CoM biosynthesis protein A)